MAPELTSCAYHKLSHILVSGFSNGTFMIHEMPDFNLIHSLTCVEFYFIIIALESLFLRV